LKALSESCLRFEAGIDDALTYLRYPGSHHARIRTTPMLERLFEEGKRRTRLVGVFPSKVSASILATDIALRSNDLWVLKRYLTMDALEAVENQTHNIRDIDPLPGRQLLTWPAADINMYVHYRVSSGRRVSLCRVSNGFPSGSDVGWLFLWR
jgi:hypothetical protein